MRAISWRAPLAALVAALAAGTACTTREHLGSTQQALVNGGNPPCPTDGGTCVEVSPPSALDGACPGERWLALASDPSGLCPAVAGADGGTWQEEKLFDEPGAPAVPSALQPYCSYEWQPSAPENAPDTNRLNAVLLPPSGPLVSALAADCYVVGPSGSSAGIDAGWRSLRNDYHQQTGWMSALPDGGSAPANIRVAVVDTTPAAFSSWTPNDDRSGHGHAVGWIIREHACPDAGGVCIGQVTDALAMPHLSVQTSDLVHGGYFGTQGELAKSIHGAVHSWRAFKAAGGSQPRMVINLSLGWDPAYGGAVPDQGSLPLPARAVYAAITHAVCQGALVVAAAGNDPGGPDLAGGPMYPAGWETQSAPSATQCQEAEGSGWSSGGTYPALAPAGVYRPLVFAVSGVNANDSVLFNARPGGLARLAAPAAHALAADGDSPTDILTGTSASAAVVSAIAATVWGYRPQLTGPEVMEIIRSSGQMLSTLADFCLGGSPCPLGTADRAMVRANLCKSIRTACAGGLGSCPATLPACTPRPAYSGAEPTLSPGQVAAMQAGDTVYDASSITYALAPLPICQDAAIWTTAAAYPDAPCPYRQFYGTPIRPWTGPQPSSNACPVCTIGQESLSSTTYDVTLSIDKEYSSVSLEKTVLRIVDANDAGYDVDLTPIVGTLTGGDEKVAKGVDLSPITFPIASATVEFAVTDPASTVGMYSTASKLIVLQ